jgi:hypothetical protein
MEMTDAARHGYPLGRTLDGGERSQGAGEFSDFDVDGDVDLDGTR